MLLPGGRVVHWVDDLSLSPSQGSIIDHTDDDSVPLLEAPGVIWADYGCPCDACWESHSTEGDSTGGDAVDQDSMDTDSLDEDLLDGDSLDEDSMEDDSTGGDSLDEDSLQENSLDENSLYEDDQYDDSLSHNPFSDYPSYRGPDVHWLNSMPSVHIGTDMPFLNDLCDICLEPMPWNFGGDVHLAVPSSCAACTRLKSSSSFACVAHPKDLVELLNSDSTSRQRVSPELGSIVEVWDLEQYRVGSLAVDVAIPSPDRAQEGELEPGSLYEEPDSGSGSPVSPSTYMDSTPSTSATSFAGGAASSSESSTCQDEALDYLQSFVSEGVTRFAVYAFPGLPKRFPDWFVVACEREGEQKRGRQRRRDIY